MRDYTNLGWPEAPFGAEQRPYGQHTDMLAAFALAFTTGDLAGDGGPLPVAAATVYLRVRRHGAALQVSADSLSVGLRATVIEDVAELPDLFTVVDRALLRARRHAVILAGHQLGDELSRMVELSAVPLRGVAGVLDAWADRSVKQRGLALMVDTAADTHTSGADLDTVPRPLAVPMPHDQTSCAEAAQRVLTCCLAIGLTAAVHTGRHMWPATFRVADAIDRAAWDILATGANMAADTVAGDTVAGAVAAGRAGPATDTAALPTAVRG